MATRLPSEETASRRDQMLVWLIRHDPHRLGKTAAVIRQRVAYLYMHTSERACRRDLEALAEEGKVVHLDNGRWTVADEC